MTKLKMITTNTAIVALSLILMSALTGCGIYFGIW